MNLVLGHCWKEWRAQRGVLVAYTLLACVSLCIGFLLVPEHWWREDGRRALALSWFVAAGVIGVVAFAAPALVRGEFGTKDDQFVRRLPGALGVSFGGKALFLVLATAALPLLGLSCGELFLTAIGQVPDDLFTWWQDGTVSFEWPWPVVFCGYGLLLVPWVWAIGTWLPGGRMALGGTALLVLLLLLCVTAVLRQSPQIEQGLHWRPWLWAVVPTGFLVASVSWVKGRRGGGPLRSARFGLAAFAIGVLPPSIWLSSQVSRYHHPDPQRLAELRVRGITTDQRFVLANASEHTGWPGASFRIDLQSGAAQQVGDIRQLFTTELLRPHGLVWWRPARHWLTFDWRNGEEPMNHRVLDLDTGEWTSIECGLANDGGSMFLMPHLPATLRAEVVVDQRRNSLLRGPGGSAAWFEDGELRVERADGTVANVPWRVERDRPVLPWPQGHGFVWKNRKGEKRLFDLTTCEPGPIVGQTDQCYFVRGALLCRPSGSGGWSRHDPDRVVRRCEGLGDAGVLGLFDDDHLLCTWKEAKGRPGLFLYGPADDSVRAIPLPGSVPLRGFATMAPIDQNGSLLARDPAGRIWLCAGAGDPDNRGNLRQNIVLLDTKSLMTNATLPHTQYLTERYELLGWPDAHSVLMQQGAQILRIDTETGERTVLFPRR